VSGPIPAGRGRWRFTLHRRVYADLTRPALTGITELIGARSRRVTQAWNQPAVLAFTIDGAAPAAALITELAHDVIGWRWDETAGADIEMFRGIVGQSQDTISEQVHTVTFTCHDYLAMLARRFTTSALTYTAVDQDTLVSNFLAQATPSRFLPASYLPLFVRLVDPAGAARSPSGVLRDRTYSATSVVGELLANLAAVAGGFDYDVKPQTDDDRDYLRVFYPYQGVLRPDVQLVYGSTVSTVSRTVDSAQYANWWRVVGNNGSEDPATPQLASEANNADANNVTVSPQGLWAGFENAPDVSVQATLDQKAAGDLAANGLVVPSYTLGLRPGAYTYGRPNMGDVVALIIQKGRLNVNTSVRVVGIDYDIGDDGQEDVKLTVGRPDTTFSDIFSAADRDVNALARR
jgi:hypothetical protein